MVNKKIAKYFNMTVLGVGEGSILLPSSMFIANTNVINDITVLIREEAVREGRPYYVSSVSVATGILVTWSPIFENAVPKLEQEEELVNDGLTYIVKKVG